MPAEVTALTFTGRPEQAIVRAHYLTHPIHIDALTKALMWVLPQSGI